MPLRIVRFLAFLGAVSLADIKRRDPEALKVDVIAAQWSWRFEYPAYNVITNELVLPVNQQVLLRMQSVDVGHSFWVPEFRVKQEILPGGKDFVRELRITPNQMGEFKARCAELCGTEHYSMLADVRVVTMEEFETWVEEAAAACREALTVYTQEELPPQWAMTQYILGNTLADQGRRLRGDVGVALLDQAVAAYRRALTVYTQDTLPQNWSTTHSALDNALKIRSSLEKQ